MVVAVGIVALFVVFALGLDVFLAGLAQFFLTFHNFFVMLFVILVMVTVVARRRRGTAITGTTGDLQAGTFGRDPDVVVLSYSHRGCEEQDGGDD